jgi:5-methylcytosine-specific restriction enzyme subunit McrC
VPTKAELDRIRYTPITAGFAPIAELSRQIANRRGLAADVDACGETKGVLLDVAELWEMYVLSVLRKAAAPLTVTHGTREKAATKKMLHSDVTGQGLGTLIPDAILHAGGQVQGVVDAKYKSLHPSASTPNGPQREDLYQMAARTSAGSFLQTAGCPGAYWRTRWTLRGRRSRRQSSSAPGAWMAAGRSYSPPCRMSHRMRSPSSAR